MSKKRRDGLAKWRLGKLEKDYKQHKKNKKNLGYLENNKVKARPAKGKFPCKRLKGEHDFKKVSEKKLPEWMKDSTDIFYYECSGCGKKKIKFIDKKFI